MNLLNKKAFITFELLLVIIISSFILINSFTSIKDLYTLTKQQQSIAITKIDLLSTKIFLEKNMDNLEKLKLKNEILYFNNSILIENIKNFTASKTVNFVKFELETTNQKKYIWILKP